MMLPLLALLDGLAQASPTLFAHLLRVSLTTCSMAHYLALYLHKMNVAKGVYQPLHFLVSAAQVIADPVSLTFWHWCESSTWVGSTDRYLLSAKERSRGKGHRKQAFQNLAELWWGGHVFPAILVSCSGAREMTPLPALLLSKKSRHSTVYGVGGEISVTRYRYLGRYRGYYPCIAGLYVAHTLGLSMSRRQARKP